MEHFFSSFLLILNCSQLPFQDHFCLANLQCLDRCQHFRQQSRKNGQQWFSKKIFKKWAILTNSRVKSKQSVFCDKNWFQEKKKLFSCELRKMTCSVLCPTALTVRSFFYISLFLAIFCFSEQFRTNKFKVLLWTFFSRLLDNTLFVEGN